MTIPLEPLEPLEPSAAASLSRSAAVKLGRPANRVGMTSRGAYPDVSRTKLAQILELHTSTVSNYFTGRTEMPLGLAQKTAAVMGLEVGELITELMSWRRKWREARDAQEVRKPAKRKEKGKKRDGRQRRY